MTLPEILKLIALIPASAVPDAFALLQEVATTGAHVKEFFDKYPQIIDAIKHMTEGQQT